MSLLLGALASFTYVLLLDGLWAELRRFNGQRSTPT